MRASLAAWRRYAAGLLFLAFALAGCAAVGAADEAIKPAPAPPVTMRDPLLGLSYDSTKVRFERVPPVLAKKADLGSLPQWIYARSEANGRILYIVSGLQRIESDDADRNTVLIEPDFGAVLSSRDGKVDVLGVPDRLYGDDALLTPQELQPLLADAVTRYVIAWGGKQNLQSALQTFAQPDAVPISLREALQAQDLHVGVAGGR
ncbi:MAG: hypothetical protein JNN30_22570 [Rhodanobacteraceae bacterium]|nr:hypothetical protein [Rhodanobacteraceae bacterium]